MGLEIITNKAPRLLVDWLDLTDAERREVDWIEAMETDCGFIWQAGEQSNA